MGRRIGIDLGTTNSVVAIIDGRHARVLDNREARPQTRSVVSLKKRRGKPGETELLVGDTALDNWPLAPRDTIISIKRLMGRGAADPEVGKVRRSYLYEIKEPSDGTSDSIRVVLGGREYSPVDISAMILRKLKEDAEHRLGEEVTHAVVTVPAYFSQIQRKATRMAGLKAGLKIIKVLEEPTAAAVAFGIEAGDSTQAKTVLVYDLGGGTFDVSILMMAGNVFATLDLEGDMWLGGDNFDQVLVDHAVKYIKQEYGIDPTSNLRFMVALKSKAQAAKELLSNAKTADIIVTGMLPDKDGDLIDLELEVTRAEYERMIRPLVDRTVEITKLAVQNAKLTFDQIDYVLLAGNATNVPLVQKAMEDLFGHSKVMRNVHPKHSVAFGAAIVATMIGGLVCQAPDPNDPDDPDKECGQFNDAEATVCSKCGTPLDLGAAAGEEGGGGGALGGVAPFHYGVKAAGDKFAVFIKKNDPYPTPNPQVQTFYTQIPNQRMISIPVYGGVDESKASANEKQGEAFAVLPPGLPAGAAVRIKVWLDDDGVFDLTAHLDDGMDLNPWILHGEKDAKVVVNIERVEQEVAKKGSDVSAEDARELERARNRAFDRLRQQDFDGAMEEIGRLDGQLADAAAGERDELTEKLRGLIGFTEMVLQRYHWALDPNKAYQLTNLVEESRVALESGNRGDMKQKFEALDKATDQLPDTVRVLLGIKNRIFSGIQPMDPALAASLLSEVEDLEEALKTRDPSATRKLQAVAEKVMKAVEQASKKRPESTKCPACGHDVPPGARHCPNCKHDLWQVGMKGPGTTSGEIRR